jgi:histidinol phosphatase-like PHP family hydrolase
MHSIPKRRSIPSFVSQDITSDAHHPEQLAYMELSLAASVLAKIPPERIINFMMRPQLRKWLNYFRGS